MLKWLITLSVRGVSGAVWFGFERKSREIKKHAVWFGSVDFKNKIRTKPMRLDRLVRFFRYNIIFCFQH